MNLLLDTHIAIWFIHGDSQLSQKANQAITQPGNISFISLASIFEIAIKLTTGKLKLSVSLEDGIKMARDNQMHLLPVEEAHLCQYTSIPLRPDH